MTCHPQSGLRLAPSDVVSDRITAFPAHNFKWFMTKQIRRLTDKITCRSMPIDYNRDLTRTTVLPARTFSEPKQLEHLRHRCRRYSIVLRILLVFGTRNLICLVGTAFALSAPRVHEAGTTKHSVYPRMRLRVKSRCVFGKAYSF